MTHQILSDLSQDALTHAIEENLFSLVSTFRRWPRAEVHENIEVRWAMTDVPFPLFNSVLAACPPAARADALIRGLTARSDARGVPLLWWTGPRSRPLDLGDRLQQHGFTQMAQVPGMAIALGQRPADEPDPAGLDVREVRDAGELAAWSATCGKALELPDAIAEANHDFMRHVDPHTTRAYVGWLDGEPVATSVALHAGGVVGIYNVATLPQCRRRGIGRAMTAAPMRDAAAAGCRAAILQATDMAENIYRAMGFREYCRIGQYVRFPSPPVTAA